MPPRPLRKTGARRIEGGQGVRRSAGRNLRGEADPAEEGPERRAVVARHVQLPPPAPRLPERRAVIFPDSVLMILY